MKKKLDYKGVNVTMQKNKKIELNKHLVKLIKTSISKKYGSKREFAKIIGIVESDFSNALKERIMPVDMLCYILYNLSLIRYNPNISVWEVKNIKKLLKKAGKTYEQIETDYLMHSNQMSCYISDGYFADEDQIKELEYDGYFQKLDLGNPYHMPDNYEVLKKILVQNLESLEDKELYFFFVNLKAIIALKDPFWAFICAIQRLSNVDVLYLDKMFSLFENEQNLLSLQYEMVREVNVDDIDFQNWKCMNDIDIIGDCIHYIECEYEEKRWYSIVLSLVYELPYIAYTDSKDWNLVSKFARMVNVKEKYPYRVTFPILKMIDGMTRGDSKLNWFITDYGEVVKRNI